MHKGSVTFDAPVPADNDALECVEPRERAFNLPSSLVAPQASSILLRRFSTVALVRRNQLNTALCQPLIERITVVGTIPNKSFGSSHSNGFIGGSFDKGDFM
ncbi:MAG: hypothetical protein JWQ21_618 [Herminiimonas sp.]|nr:hypothetical protein [Herminiimonas sp.]